ncbi:MAG TPA: tetratricopeptide repeat protein [Variovorax sp.]|nr:tetratricopeptide repeat protein [Variovorax sp.]
MLALCLGWVGSARADQYADVNTLLRQGRANDALAKADAYVTANPRDPQMRFLRGVILTDQGKQADAISAFLALTQEFPELPEPYNNLAALYAAQSQFSKARDALETAIQRNPNYATAHENLGDVYVRLAAQSYGRAQELDKRNTAIAPKLALLREVFLPKPAAAKPAATGAGTRDAETGTPAQR